MDITKLLNGIRPDPMIAAPMYLQLANSLTAKIQNFTLPAGAKLLPERELAQLLGVSRTTVVNAYKLLDERGLITTKVGSGTYIRDVSTDTDAPAFPWEQFWTSQYKSPLSSLLRTLISLPANGKSISFAAGTPDSAFYPLQAMEEALGKQNFPFPREDLGHLPTEGYLPLRHSIAAWQQQFGITATPDNILIVSGAQQGLYLTIKALIEPRDYVIVESPTYIGAIQILEASGARILCLPPSNTLNFDILEDYLIRYRPKLFYTMPTFQNPTGRVMSLQERQTLISLAARYRLIIVEDDPYGQLYYKETPPPSLKALDSYGGVIYLGTFSKILFPGLRTGWVTAAPQVLNRLCQDKQYIDLHSNNLSQKLLHLFLENNKLASHLLTVRKEYKKRRDAMASAVRRYCNDYLDFNVPEGGFYLWCKINPHISLPALLRQAAAHGISFVPGAAFYTNGSESNEIRLCYATHNEEITKEGIRTLGKILSSGSVRTPPPSGPGLPII